MQRHNMFRYYKSVSAWDRFLQKTQPTLQFRLDNDYPVQERSQVRVFRNVVHLVKEYPLCMNEQSLPFFEVVIEQEVRQETRRVRQGLSEDTRRSEYENETFTTIVNVRKIVEVDAPSMQLEMAVAKWVEDKKAAHNVRMEEYLQFKQEGLDALIYSLEHQIDRECDAATLISEADDLGFNGPFLWQIHLWAQFNKQPQPTPEHSEPQPEHSEPQPEHSEPQPEHSEPQQPLATMSDLLNKWGKK